MIIYLFVFSASNPDGMFLILSNLGVITVNGSLDREYKTSYLLRVGVSIMTGVLGDVMFLVRLQGKFEVDHSWEYKC